MAYEQAFKDREYLWNTYGSAEDMTGGYVDQDDLDKLLRSPTKKTAKECLKSQISYWFSVGPGKDAGADVEAIHNDPQVQEIADRYYCEIELVLS